MKYTTDTESIGYSGTIVGLGKPCEFRSFYRHRAHRNESLETNITLLFFTCRYIYLTVKDKGKNSSSHCNQWQLGIRNFTTALFRILLWSMRSNWAILKQLFIARVRKRTTATCCANLEYCAWWEGQMFVKCSNSYFWLLRADFSLSLTSWRPPRALIPAAGSHSHSGSRHRAVWSGTFLKPLVFVTTYTLFLYAHQEFNTTMHDGVIKPRKANTRLIGSPYWIKGCLLRHDFVGARAIVCIDLIYSWKKPCASFYTEISLN